MLLRTLLVLGIALVVARVAFPPKVLVRGGGARASVPSNRPDLEALAVVDVQLLVIHIAVIAAVLTALYYLLRPAFSTGVPANQLRRSTSNQTQPNDRDAHPGSEVASPTSSSKRRGLLRDIDLFPILLGCIAIALAMVFLNVLFAVHFLLPLVGGTTVGSLVAAALARQRRVLHGLLTPLVFVIIGFGLGIVERLLTLVPVVLPP